MKKTTYNRSDYDSLEQLFFMNKDKWFSGNFLKKRYDINTISLQKIIHDMRCNGITIISGGNKGYKFTTDKEEIMRTYLSLKNRAESINHATGMYNTYLESQLKNDEGNHSK